MRSVFSDFRSRVILRVILLAVTVSLLIYMLDNANMLFAAMLTGVVLVLQVIELFRFVNQTNRKLTRFLESVRYSDFIMGFASDNKLGKSFKDLNIAFNEVLEAFRKARSEKEEHWQYLNTVVQQVRTGLLSFDSEGEIQLINTNARRYMGVQTINNIHELKESNVKLYEALMDVISGKGVPKP
jgi:signal transduction histidine kinase